MPHATSAPLTGWYVISLRPLAQHGPVRRAAAALGASTFAISTLQLRPLAAGAALRAALACARVIVTSPAAARFAAAQRPLAPRRGQRWFAIGAGTAAALQRAGVRDVQLPASRADSEGLLAHAQLQQLRGCAIGLITAPGGRDLLAASLRQRGASVRLAPVYQRVARPPAPSRLRALAAIPLARSALLISSGEALTGLWQALDPPARAALTRRLCVSSSPRLDQQLQALGFTRRVVAGSARPGDMLAALHAHAARTRPAGFR